VRVKGQQAHYFGVPDLGLPDPRPGQEEPLRPGQPVDALRFGAIQRDAPGLVGDAQTAEVADVLADRQRAVHVVAGGLCGFEHVVLRDQLLRQLVERLPVGENIGDLGGLGIAYQAWRISLNGAEPEVVDGLTGTQRFFLSWARVWQTKIRDAEVVRLLALDPHSPAEFRCNQVVRNLDEFHQAFEVRPGDGLWLDPADRVQIW